MLDEEDLDFAILSSVSGGGGGWLWGLICLVAFVVLAIVVAMNEDECAKKHCAHGKGMLVHHECICADKPVDE